ncbi:protein phosphatase 1 regulatory subunit spinophilin isoform X2 [Arctopsyche grandis]|uniref:protein phosphatase 1 regulatory subunit spinophilin isoform X2 n=1 Tax=Arctopsyche grandis TaxID=121162 RepID=UPI00406D963F
MEDMEEKRRTSSGSKVSQIANIFQSMAPARETQPTESAITVSGTVVPGAQVTVVRTESHLARFNNARALFEKLGEESRPLHRVEKSPSAGGGPTGLGSLSGRSRSSSAGSRAGRLSRSPSPPKPDLLPHNNHRKNATDNNKQPLISNGNIETNDVRIKSPKTEYKVMANSNGSIKDINNKAKPLILSKKPEKPEKPERKFNSKELIEKQRNWTSHFSKARTARPPSDVKPPTERNVQSGIRSPFRSPPLSPPLASASPPRVLSPPLVSSPTTATRTSPVTPVAAVRPTTSPPAIPNLIPLLATSLTKIPSPAKESPKHVASPTLASSPSPVSSPTPKTASPIPKAASPVSNAASPSPKATSPSPKATSPSPKTTSPSPKATSPSSYAASPTPNAVSPTIVSNHQKDASPSPTSPVKDITGPTSPISSPKSPSSVIENQLLENVENQLIEGRSCHKSPEHEARSPEFNSEEANEPMETEKRNKAIASMCLNIAGQLPSRTSSVSDEGGFNEPSPEIKARLKPPSDGHRYSFQQVEESVPASEAQLSPRTRIEISNNHDVVTPDSGVIMNSVLAELESRGSPPDVYRPLYIETATQPKTDFSFNSDNNLNSNSNRMNLDDRLLQNDSASIHQQDSGVVISEMSQGSLEVLDKSVNSQWSIQSDGDVMRLDNSLLDTNLTSTSSLNEYGKCEAEASVLEDGSDEGARWEVGEVETVANNKGPDNMMTPDEAELMLSSSILEKKIRQEAILSDEQAQEIVRLLSPKADDSPKSAQPAEQNQTHLTNGTNNSGLVDSMISMNDSYQSMLSYDSGPTINDSYASLINESGLQSDRLADTLADSMEVSTGSLQGVGEPETDQSSYLCPPQPIKVIGEQDGVHFFEDGHFWTEIPGLPPECEDTDDDDDYYPPVFVKKSSKVSFSTAPMRMFSTHSVMEYDRRNEDVDPVAASAEYELEKRVEKMLVFPVRLLKGPDGLGLSIIGMGVGADAGLEKLGIFVKTINDNGAAARDGRIHVNDQIIEVDGKSLVGVTQAYAASVLRNTSGLVNFQIGREKDPQNSEVAQLIKQSLQADREREERNQRAIDERQRRQSEDSTQPVSSGNSSTSEPPPPPPVMATSPPPSINTSPAPIISSQHSQDKDDVESLRSLLQETQSQLISSESCVSQLKQKLMELESNGAENEEFSEKLRQSGLKLRETERNLKTSQREAQSYKDMLQQSQEQYSNLDSKYNKAKKLLRDFRQREIEMLHREEFYQQVLQEKDTEYNSLVKTLKDRIIRLEVLLLETQKKAGVPVMLPYEPSAKQVTPQMTRRPPPEPFQRLDSWISDGDLSSEGSPQEKTATVERRTVVANATATTVTPSPSTTELIAAEPEPAENGAARELDLAIPQTALLDTSAQRTRGDLARQRHHSPHSLSNASSYDGLDESYNDSNDDSLSESTSASNEHQLNSINREENPESTLSSLTGDELGQPQYSEVFKRTSGEYQVKDDTYSTVTHHQFAGPLAVKKVGPGVAVGGEMPWQPLGVPGTDSPSLSPLSASTTSFSPHHTTPIIHWTKQQVWQWIVAQGQGMERYASAFASRGVDGALLITITSRDLKLLGVTGDDKQRLKRKLKELRTMAEKERRLQDKHDKMLKKAEKRNMKKK